MKKHELAALIQESILGGLMTFNEGVMDNLTTQLSRAVVNHIKHHASEKHIPDFRTSVDDLSVLVQTVERSPNPGVETRGASYSPRDRLLKVKLKVPSSLEGSDFSTFIPKFKNTIRHELEHRRQHERSGDTRTDKMVTHARAPQSPISGVYSNGDDTPDGIKAYLLEPTEVEAFVMGSYKEAKTRKVSISQVFREKFQQIQKYLSRLGTPEQTKDVIQTVWAAWRAYAEKRLPPGVLKLKTTTTLTEGVMDNMTTQLSRLVVDHIKEFGQTQQGIPDFKGNVNDLLVHVQFNNDYDNGPMHIVDGSYNYLARKLTARIVVPRHFSSSDLSDFIPKFKNLLRHELEHYRQDQRSGYEEPAKGVHHTLPGASQQPPGASSGTNPYTSIESTYNYLLNPKEVEAWVMGMYKQAKTQKVPLYTLLQKQSDELAEKLPSKSISPENAQWIADTVLLAWQDYVAKRLPRVELP